MRRLKGGRLPRWGAARAARLSALVAGAVALAGGMVLATRPGCPSAPDTAPGWKDVEDLPWETPLDRQRGLRLWIVMRRKVDDGTRVRRFRASPPERFAGLPTDGSAELWFVDQQLCTVSLEFLGTRDHAPSVGELFPAASSDATGDTWSRRGEFTVEMSRLGTTSNTSVTVRRAPCYFQFGDWVRVPREDWAPTPQTPARADEVPVPGPPDPG